MAQLSEKELSALNDLLAGRTIISKEILYVSKAD